MTSSSGALKNMLALVLDISKNEVKIPFEFELRMRFKGVALIKDEPKELNS